MAQEEQKEVQVNQVLRDHQARGAGRDRWALGVRLDHQVLERKDPKASKDVQVLLVLLDLWGQKVQMESRVPQEASVLQGRRVFRVKQELQEQKVIEELQECQDLKETRERGDHVDQQVNLDNLDHKALPDPRDPGEMQVSQVQQDFPV